jgi:hypothetical protein
MIFSPGVKRGVPLALQNARLRAAESCGRKRLYKLGLAEARANARTGPSLSWGLVLVIGLVGGFLSGLLGIGGGTAMVPLLVLLGGLSQRESHATSLAAMILIAAAALIVYGGAGEVDVVAAAALLVGSLLGARRGADILARAPERALKVFFGLFLLFAAAMLVLEA